MSNQTPKPNTRHKRKYKWFIEACEDEAPTILVAGLWVLWDTVEELQCNIGIAKENDKTIVIADIGVTIQTAELRR